ncbi:MAG TPA: hypothetical protein VFE99_09285, partial [Agromyces sp.]|nr:hypothetical protein [Agromyces sp.]
RAERSVVTLTEMLADDGARRSVGNDALRRALAQVGNAGESGSFPDVASGASPDAAMLAARLDRLERPEPVRGGGVPTAVRGAVLAASVVLVSIPLIGMAIVFGLTP